MEDRKAQGCNIVNSFQRGPESTRFTLQNRNFLVGNHWMSLHWFAAANLKGKEGKKIKEKEGKKINEKDKCPVGKLCCNH